MTLELRTDPCLREHVWKIAEYHMAAIMSMFSIQNLIAKSELCNDVIDNEIGYILGANFRSGGLKIKLDLFVELGVFTLAIVFCKGILVD